MPHKVVQGVKDLFRKNVIREESRILGEDALRNL